jgi:hypothetical protein
MSSVLFTTLLTALTLHPAAQGRWVHGTYENPALGYEIVIPKGLKGRTGDQSGPERGFRIGLPSGGQISVWAEPNALEFASAAEAMRNMLEHDECPADGFTVLATRVGRIEGAEGALTCGDRHTRILMAIGPHTDLIYCVWLTTAASNTHNDVAVLKRLASTLRMIRRE